ncbi:MAG: IS21 family transposase, partial [Fibrobacterales bacterium]
MNKAIQILKYHFDSKLSNEKVGLAVGVSKGSVNNCLQRFKNSNINWGDAKTLSEVELEKVLFPITQLPPNSALRKGDVFPDYHKTQIEMGHPQVTLQLLYDEFKMKNPNCIGRSQFYDGYKKHVKTTKTEMHVDHKAGDKFFVDYSGDSIGYYDRERGEYVDTGLFVGTWGASCFTYAEVTESQKSEDWVYSHVRAFKYSGCTPAAIVPDNLKSAVIKPCIYEPELNPLYKKMAEHYSSAVLPARVRKPQDKGIVENHVLHIQRYILGRLRNHRFYSLAEVNEEIREQLEAFNDLPMKGYGGMSRRELFMELDKKYAQDLPPDAFEVTHIKQGVRVAPNYHIQFKKHHYSISHILVGERVDVYQKGNVIEVYHKGVHITRHQKSSKSIVATHLRHLA